jgi:hypothetical protein
MIIYIRNITLKIILAFAGVVFMISGCEPWNETADASQLSQLPVFEIIDGDFQSFVVTDSAEYSDPGALALSNGKPLEVIAVGEVDLTEIGIYTITYYAKNSIGLWSSDERIVAVTWNDVSGNDISGSYTGTNWDPQTEMTVQKIHPDGYYQCTEVMGFPGTTVSGNIVDLGNHELVLVHGEGDFGRFNDGLGAYTLSSLSWPVILLDDPYNGLEVEVFWSKEID